MERSKYFAVVANLLFTTTCFSQPSHCERIYQAFIDGDMQTWHQVISDIEDEEPEELNQQLELLNYYYGYTAWLIGNDKKREAKDYIIKSEDLIESILKRNPQHASAKAYKGAFIGFKIGLNPVKAPFLGPHSIRDIEDALQIDPNNVQANIEHANALYYRPALFGGDKNLAIEHYEKAIQLMEEQNEIEQNWGYLNLLTVLAQAYEETGSLHQAKKLFEKILNIEPAYSWVKDELYPALLQKL